MMPDSDTVQQVGESLSRTYKRALTRLRVVLYDVFTEHPRAQRLSYCQHFTRAARSALHTGRASLAFAVHAVFPFLFQTTGSTIVHQLHQEHVYEKAVLKSAEEVDRIIASHAEPPLQAHLDAPLDAHLDAQLDALLDEQ